MAEVGHVTPGKPIWPEHHGDLPERRAPKEQGVKQRKPRSDGTAEQNQPQDDRRGGHLDEYV